MSCGTCSGKCCDPVVLSLSPQDIAEAYIAAKTGIRDVANKVEINKIYKNLTFKGVSRVSPMEKGVYKDKGVMHMYECKNFDYDTRKCTDYENRMQFCKDYGDKSKCGYENTVTN